MIMNANLNPSAKTSNVLQTLKEEFRVVLHFAYLVKKVFLFML